MREQASEVDGKFKSVWNLQAMTEKGEICKNYQTKIGLLESKLSKNILGDRIFINFMQKNPLKQNLCQTIQSATLEHPAPMPLRYILI